MTIKTKTIRIDRTKVGRNAELEDGFSLGTTPDGYGIMWSQGPDGLGQKRFWFEFDFKSGAAKIESDGTSYIFCLSDTPDTIVREAKAVDVKSEMDVR